MSSRQNSLLVAEDWKKVYQTFREADFQSYDFETLRKSMIDYLRLYYPEDFNDFIESSEYIALIDLIAFLGQSLAFRTDLNARENFLDTAERRDSILKLARLVSYSPKRSIAASGLLKITSVATTETLTDSSGINLSNLIVSWNDTTNNNWQEQFSLILNATLLNSQVIGKSGNSQVINGIKTDEYTINITSQTMPVFPFNTTIGGTNMSFEAVSATSINQPYIYETNPRPISKFNILYRNDNQGNGSNNTGFFLFFKQGRLQTVDFTLGESVPNRILNVGFNNINNSDVWLYDIDSANLENNLWKSVPTVAGVNVIYNKSVERNLYQISTKAGDQIDLVFGDGSFSNVPQGNYRIYFRTSNGLTYKITPDEVQNATIAINYISRAGNLETLTIRANLNYTVTNANANESLNDIRQKAPQQYYSQGRMITGEDYNIIPYTAFSNILKVKAVNRTSSGVSRYLDVNDSSGKYSSTNIFAEDGYLYKEEFIDTLNFTFLTTSNVQRLVQDDLTTILSSREMLHFYYAKFTEQSQSHSMPNAKWHMSSVNNNGSTGYFIDSLTNELLQCGSISSQNTKYVRVGAVIKFAPPADYYFNAQSQLIKIPNTGLPAIEGIKEYIYASILQVVGDGTAGGAGNFSNGQGPITLSQKVPSGAVINGIIPVFQNSLPEPIITDIVARVLAYNDFALRYNTDYQFWEIIEKDNIDPTSPFDWNTNANWLIRFEYSNNVGYSVKWRGLNYYFESNLETKFYFDNKLKIYDSKSGTTIRDQIKILKINSHLDTTEKLGIDYVWYIYKNIVAVDGYEEQNKVLVTFTDDNADGIPDNPDIFDTLVNPAVNTKEKFIFFKQETGYNSFISYKPVAFDSVVRCNDISDIVIADYPIGKIFYVVATNKFYQSVDSSNYIEVYDYIAKQGRGDLYFQYRHNSPGYRRIDPSPNNIVDLFMLPRSYATDYQNWIRDVTNMIVEPVPPTTEQLKLEYSELENYKAISDTIIFNSAKFKPLFGSKASASLQATFKIVKNTAINVSDNDIKSSVVNAINTYFSIENWDFGESFYFSELSAYLHTALSPNVSSIIIVPADPTSMFGSLYQINAEANEILTSSATVDNVEIISAITAAQINANFAGLNTFTFGTS